MELDGKDRRILCELDKNARYSSSKIGRLAGLRKEVVNYRISKLISEGIITRFFAEINTAKLGYSVFKVYLQFQNINTEREKEITEYLESHHNICWIAVCSGRWDMLVAFWARDIFEFNEILTEFLNRFSDFILAKEIVINLRYCIYSRKWLTNDRNPKVTCIGGRPENMDLDEKDLKILRILTRNGREHIVDIARKIGISPALAIYRMRELMKRGVITTFRIDINRAKLGLEFCKSFLYLQNKTTEKERKLIRFCSLHPNITALTQCIGPWDLELELETRSFEEFHMIMKDIKTRFPELVRSYESVVISKESGVRYIPK